MRRILLVLLIATLASDLSFAAAKQSQPALKSHHVLVLDEQGKVLVSKNTEKPTPIASITKLMTAMVVLDSALPLDNMLTITKADRDMIKKTGSRLKYGSKLSRREMLKLALSASENRAAHALSRHFPGGEKAFIRAMNRKAKELDMQQTHFKDATGLNPGNVSTASDLAKMVRAALKYPFIKRASTTKQVNVRPFTKSKAMTFNITNRLLRSNNPNWRIHLTKTGYIKEAGRCLVMRADTAGKQLTIVLLNSFGKLTPYGDSNRIRKWLMRQYGNRVAWSH